MFWTWCHGFIRRFCGENNSDEEKEKEKKDVSATMITETKLRKITNKQTNKQTVELVLSSYPSLSSLLSSS